MFTKFWLTDINILYDRNHILEIYPSSEFDIIRKLNAIFRFSVYYSLIVFLLNRNNTNVFYIPIVVGILTYVIFKKNKSVQVDGALLESINGNKDSVQNMGGSCRIPTKDNPFMNPMLSDFGNNVEVKSSCTSFDNKGLQRKIDEYFEDGIFKEYSDIFKNKNSQRQFFTVPGGDIPNDQGSFAQWLYGSPPICKEGNQIDCLSFRNGGGGSSGGGGASGGGGGGASGGAP